MERARGSILPFVLAGGYTYVMAEDELVDLHMKTVRAFSSADSASSGEGALAAKLARRPRPNDNNRRRDDMQGSGDRW